MMQTVVSFARGLLIFVARVSSRLAEVLDNLVAKITNMADAENETVLLF